MADGTELQVRKAVCPGFPDKVSLYTHLWHDDLKELSLYNMTE